MSILDIKGYKPKDLPSLSNSDLDKINEARKTLLHFLVEKINDSTGILKYHIDYLIDYTSKSTVHSTVTFEGEARRIQEECRRLVEGKVDDALRFSELLMRLVLYNPSQDLKLTFSDEIELFEYLKNFALNEISIKNINVNTELDFNL